MIEIHCEVCGEYVASREWRSKKAADAQWPDKLVRIGMRALVRSATDEAGEPPVFTVDSYKELAKVAYTGFPKDSIEQMHRFIRLAARRAKYFGGPSAFDSDLSMAVRLHFEWSFADTRALVQKCEAFMQAVAGRNLVERTVGAACRFDCTLKPDGWALAEDLQRREERQPSADESKTE